MVALHTLTRRPIRPAPGHRSILPAYWSVALSRLYDAQVPVWLSRVLLTGESVDVALSVPVDQNPTHWQCRFGPLVG